MERDSRSLRKWLWAGLALLLFGVATALLGKGITCNYVGTARETCSEQYVTLIAAEKVLAFLNDFNGLMAASAGIAVAYFTRELKRSTDRLWEAGERQIKEARKSADAAKRAAEAAEKSVAMMDDTARRQMRAYVTIDPAGIEKILLPTQIARITIKNSGDLPASDVRWIIYSDIDENRLRKDFDVDVTKIEPGTNLLAPKDGMSRFQDLHHAKATVEKIGRDEAALYVWGQVFYQDGFGKERWTKFCHRYEKDCMRLIDTATGHEMTAKRARQHQYGNGTDEAH